MSTVRSTTPIVGAFAGSFTVNKPAGTVAGDILLVCIYMRPDWATPTLTGFTPLGVADTGGGTPADTRLVVWWRRVDGTEPASWTLTFAGSTRCGGAVYAVQDADPSVNPSMASATGPGGASPGTINLPATPAAAAPLTIYVYGGNANNNDLATLTAPASSSPLTTQHTSGGGTFGTAYRAGGQSATTAAYTAGSTPVTVAGITVAVPGPSGGPRMIV